LSYKKIVKGKEEVGLCPHNYPHLFDNRRMEKRDEEVDWTTKMKRG